MVVADITIWLVTLFLFNYIVIYRRNKFLGSIGYLLFGIIMFGTRVEFGYSQTIYGYISLFIMLGALTNLIYETVAKWSGGTRKISA